jgi:hypothetical protein
MTYSSPEAEGKAAYREGDNVLLRKKFLKAVHKLPLKQLFLVYG